MRVRMSMLGGAALVSVAAAASAQEVELPAIDTVAEVRSEALTITRGGEEVPLRSVPDAISLFTADELENRYVLEPLELVRDVPNMVGAVVPGPGSGTIYFLRGIGNQELLPTSDTPVGTFVDGVNLSRLGANHFGMFDVESIAVHRGPQSLRFGRNSSGGAVDVRLHRPGDEIHGMYEAFYGEFDRKAIRGSFDFPLSPSFAVNLSGYLHETDGYVENVTTGRTVNEEDRSGVRLGVRLDPTERLSWNFGIAKLDDQSLNLLNFECNPADPAMCDDRYATTGLGAEVERPATVFGGAGVAGEKARLTLGNDAETTLITSEIAWTGEAHRLALITGIVDLTQRYAVDFLDGREAPTAGDPEPPVRGFPLGGLTRVSDADHSQFSQDVRLSGELFGGLLGYMAGGAYYSEENREDFADLSTVAAAGGPETSLLADRLLHTETEAKSAYASLDLKPMPALSLSAGVRYTDEERRLSVNDNRAGCGADCLVNANLSAPLEQSDDIWTPHVAAGFTVTEDVLLFAKAARGYRSAGWNGAALDPAALTPFGMETNWTYEGGLKTSFWDGRVQANLTGFYLEAENVQTPALIPGVGETIAGLADLRNKGVELELTAVPVRGLNLYANLGYQDAEYRTRDGAPALDAFGVQSVAAQQAACGAELAGGGAAPSCAVGIVDASGNLASPVRTPELTAALGASYDFYIRRAESFVTPSVNLTYRSEMETGYANASIFEGSNFARGSHADGVMLVNAGLALRTDDDWWLVSVECDNCFDESYTDASFAGAAYLGRPMTWTFRARRKF